MATKAQLEALKKARKVRASNLKKKYGSGSGGRTKRSKGLGGFSLGSVATVKQKDVLEMVKNSGAIILGYVAGKVTGNLIAKAVVKPGDEQGFAKYIEPILQLGGGVILTASAGKNQFFKYAGAGMVTSGVVTGIERITKKSIMDLLGVNKLEGFLGLDEGSISGAKTIDEIDNISFTPNLPELEGIDDEIDFEGFEGLNNITSDSDIIENTPTPADYFSGMDDDDGMEIL
ncbi:MAG: hypothetical protein LBQ22_13085 [Bacteroidales bacterium]|jgi:hypothetical protein|nr:hypothetical protein [Bacteroidales bacterium]